MQFRIAFSKIALDRKLPPQHELPEGDKTWRNFNASFENMQLEPIDIIKFVYEGHAMTTWHKDHWRVSDNFLLGQHIGLDFDSCDKYSSLAWLSKDPFIRKYAQIIHTTPSHRDEAPRARVIFVLDEPIHQHKNYAAAASALLWQYGMADRQCKDPVRFFYGSVNCEFEWFPDNTLPLAVIKKIIADHRMFDELQEKKRKAAQARASFNAPTEMKDVQAALSRIPAWGIDYDEWLTILMALHAEYGDAALGLAESWADGTDGEVRRKWKSFKPNGNASGRAGLGSVFAIAKRFGWTRPMELMAA